MAELEVTTVVSKLKEHSFEGLYNSLYWTSKIQVMKKPERQTCELRFRSNSDCTPIDEIYNLVHDVDEGGENTMTLIVIIDDRGFELLNARIEAVTLLETHCDNDNPEWACHFSVIVTYDGTIKHTYETVYE